MKEIIIEAIVILGIWFVLGIFFLKVAAKIVIEEIKEEFFTYNDEEPQWTAKDLHRMEWEQWKAQREYEEFEEWKRKKDEGAKA